jgi:hypothetical protein
MAATGVGRVILGCRVDGSAKAGVKIAHPSDVAKVANIES